MSKPIPFPVRVAAGLIATGVDHLQRLPDELPALSVTVAGKAASMSLKVQQEITGWASRGEEILGEMFHQPTEHPAWARFDDEEDTAKATNDEATNDEADDAAPESGTRDAFTPSAAGDDTGDDEPLPGFDELRIAQLRGRLRHLSVDMLETLLAYEYAHQGRPAFITMLSNRLTTLRSAESDK